MKKSELKSIIRECLDEVTATKPKSANLRLKGSPKQQKPNYKSPSKKKNMDNALWTQLVNKDIKVTGKHRP
jgi:hypothetical protein